MEGVGKLKTAENWPYLGNSDRWGQSYY